MRTIVISAAVVIAFILAANEGPNFAPNAIGMGMICGLVWLSKRGDFRVSNKSKDPELQTPKKALRGVRGRALREFVPKIFPNRNKMLYFWNKLRFWGAQASRRPPRLIFK